MADLHARNCNQHDDRADAQGPWHRLHDGFRYWTNLLLIPMFVQMILEARAGWDEVAGDYEGLELFYCANFFIDWALGLAVADDRRKWLKNPANIVDLVSSIPLGYLFQGLRAARMLRAIRVLRVLFRARRFRGKGTQLVRVMGLLGAVTFAGAIAFQIVEPEATSGLEEALWWSLVTLSTVGYGDIMPTTPAGHFVAFAIIIAGLGAIGYTAGFMTSIVDDQPDETLERIREIDARLARIEAALALAVEQKSADTLTTDRRP
jgi:voltage-gated potassium channel